MEDEKIIELFFQRSENAIKQLDGKYGKLLRSISFNILPDKQDVEECANDTLMCVWNEIPPAKPDNLRAFVCKISRRISINRYKHNTRKKRCGAMDLLLSELDECIPSADNICEEAESNRTTALINEWIRSLDDEMQIMFVHRYFMMASIAQLSEAFSLSESNVSTKLYRARKSLKSYLEKEGICV